MKKHILIIGPRNSGKSTIANWLNDTDRPIKKAQDAIYGKYTIDIPAAYVENNMYSYLLSLAQTAGRILCLADGQEKTNIYSPNFFKSFNCPAIGIIKAPASKAELEIAGSYLSAAGVEGPYHLFDAEKLVLLKQQWIAELKEAYDEVYN